MAFHHAMTALIPDHDPWRAFRRPACFSFFQPMLKVPHGACPAIWTALAQRRARIQRYLRVQHFATAPTTEVTRRALFAGAVRSLRATTRKERHYLQLSPSGVRSAATG
jgi:hypothetical protein